MCLCYLFSAKTAWQVVNRNADFLQTNRFESIHITNRINSIRIANWNALTFSAHVLLLSKALSNGRYFPRKKRVQNTNTEVHSVDISLLLLLKATAHSVIGLLRCFPGVSVKSQFVTLSGWCQIAAVYNFYSELTGTGSDTGKFRSSE